MAPEPSKDAHKGGYSPHMKTVGWAILIMGVSLVLVIVAWMGIGTDPNYTAKVMQEQQSSLREQYGLPAQETSTAELEIPPSLRDTASAGNATSAAANGTGGNQTATANATAGNQTGAGNGTAAAPASGGTKVSITQGAASKTADAYDPNPVQGKVGGKVTWTNDDSTPHTATSGKDSKPDGTFDSSTLAQGKSFSFTFEKAGEYPYFCTLHPTMVGTVSTS